MRAPAPAPQRSQPYLIQMIILLNELEMMNFVFKMMNFALKMQPYR